MEMNKAELIKAARVLFSLETRDLYDVVCLAAEQEAGINIDGKETSSLVEKELHSDHYAKEHFLHKVVNCLADGHTDQDDKELEQKMEQVFKKWMKVDYDNPDF